MGQNPHYFIAIPLNSIVKEWLAEYQKQIRHESFISYKNWTDPEDFHITLKFFGAVSQEKLSQLGDKLKKVEAQDSFNLTIGTIGTFGKPTQPRVLWAGVEKTEALQSLFETVEKLSKEIGFPKENRPYRPHITIAKKWKGTYLSEVDLSKLTTSYIGEKQALIDHFVLYQIHPERSPKYEVIQTIELK